MIKLKGIDNLNQCIENCSIEYQNENAIIKNKNNQYLIDYENIGIYDMHSKIWYWSFGFNFKDDNKIQIAKNIKNVFKKIIKNKTNKFNSINFSQEDLELLIYYTKNGIYLSKDNVELLIKLCIVLSDVIWIFPYKTNNSIAFIAIKQILNSK